MRPFGSHEIRDKIKDKVVGRDKFTVERNKDIFGREKDDEGRENERWAVLSLPR